jgi:hypothetical protein
MNRLMEHSPALRFCFRDNSWVDLLRSSPYERFAQEMAEPAKHARSLVEFGFSSLNVNAFLSDFPYSISVTASFSCHC